MTWHKLRVTPLRSREAVVETLFAAGSQGVHEDEGDFVTHFPPDTDVESLLADLEICDPGCGVAVSDAPTEDPTTWHGSVGVQRLGRLTIAPPWLAAGLDLAHTVIVEPAMAFGTGEHETTRGVVRLMQLIPIEGASVADLGAGSAVLAIAAAKLGAARAVAIEIDADAIGNAEENVVTNGVEDRVGVIEGDAVALLPLVAPVDLIVANILSSVLAPLLPLFAGSLAPGGHAILSGILTSERSEMLAAIEGAGFRVLTEDVEGEWCSALIARR